VFVNLQIPATTTRILLNHFKWDKEKLMERFYDGDQEKLFAEARVINPFRKSLLISRSRSSQNSLVNIMTKLMKYIIFYKIYFILLINEKLFTLFMLIIINRPKE